MKKAITLILIIASQISTADNLKKEIATAELLGKEIPLQTEEEIDHEYLNPKTATRKIGGWMDIKGRKYRFQFTISKGSILQNQVCKPIQNVDYTDCLAATKIMFGIRCIDYSEPMYCEAFKALSLP
ncbi:hypothetical protein OSS47_04300 [Pseudomonas citronellolis]|uniref:hypothetical protein n=1 Tax=Pseudomonas citronellolis TaxID=53408 RepID=UPI00226DE623|nr:hypothetical protein [Pseudomonas citronellolis]WAB93209.1 hypothetical protein OSS47_04300 [Pseudomonas citronellolis]